MIDSPSYRLSILDEPLSLREKEVEADDSGGLEGPERIGERYDMTPFCFVDLVQDPLEQRGVSRCECLANLGQDRAPYRQR